MGKATELFKEIGEYIDNIDGITVDDLRDNDFDVVVNSYFHFNSLIQKFTEEIQKDLKVMGDYIAETYTNAAKEQQEESSESNEVTEEVTESSADELLELSRELNIALNNAGFDPSEITEDSVNEGGYIQYCINHKIAINPKVNWHGDYSWHILVLRGKGQNCIARTFNNVDKVVQYLKINASEVEAFKNQQKSRKDKE